MAKIREFERDYRGEWLAIEVEKEGVMGPEEGKLLFHAKDRDAVWQRIKMYPQNVYVMYAGPPLKKGYAAAF